MSLADMAHTFALRRQNTVLQAEVQRLSVETVTGVASDTGRAVGGDFTQLSAITGTLARLEAYGHTGSLAATLAAGSQSALDTIGTAIGPLGMQMSDPTLTGSPASVDALGASAAQAFRATVSALNMQVAGQSLFAGTRTDGAALADADAILSSLKAATAGATSAAELSAGVADWFASAEGFGAMYRGGADRAPAAVGDADRVEVSVTAADPALVQTLSALATGALLSDGALAGREGERQAMARQTGAALLNAEDARVTLSARLGASEARLADIQTRNTAQISAMRIAQSDILSVDTFETATRLEATQTQIETLYSVTARLSKMSLADLL